MDETSTSQSELSLNVKFLILSDQNVSNLVILLSYKIEKSNNNKSWNKEMFLSN